MAWEYGGVAVSSVGSGKLKAALVSSLRTAPKAFTWSERLGLHFVSGSTGSVYYSDNLRYWMSTGLASNGGVVAVDEIGLVLCWTDGVIYSSPDGDVWTERYSSAELTVNLVKYIPETSTVVACCTTGKVLTSADGITWTEVTTPVATGLNCAVYAHGLYCIGGGLGTILTSPDCVTWTARTSGVSGTVLDMAVDASGVAVGVSGTNVIRSVDLITWSTVKTVPGAANRVGYSPDSGLFFVGDLASTGLRLITSPDGITWTNRSSPELPGSTTGAMPLVYCPKLKRLCILGNSRLILATSDGTQWLTPELVSALLILGISYRGTVQPSIPDGWTLVGNINTGNTSTTASTSISSIMMAYKVCADDTYPGVSMARTSGDVIHATTLCYYGSALDPLEDYNLTTLSTNNTVVSCTGVTTTTPGALIVVFGAYADNINATNCYAQFENTTPSTVFASILPPSVDPIERSDALTTLGADTGSGSWDFIKPSAGSTGTVRYTASASSRHSIGVLAFKSADQGPGPDIASVIVDQLSTEGGRVSADIQF